MIFDSLKKHFLHSDRKFLFDMLIIYPYNNSLKKVSPDESLIKMYFSLIPDKPLSNIPLQKQSQSCQIESGYSQRIRKGSYIIFHSDSLKIQPQSYYFHKF